jgi:hypothetical protein
MRKRSRCHAPEKRRTKQKPGSHFAHHAWLTNAMEDDAEQVRCRQHHTHLKKE